MCLYKQFKSLQTSLWAVGASLGARPPPVASSRDGLNTAGPRHHGSSPFGGDHRWTSPPLVLTADPQVQLDLQPQWPLRPHLPLLLDDPGCCPHWPLASPCGHSAQPHSSPGPTSSPSCRSTWWPRPHTPSPQAHRSSWLRGLSHPEPRHGCSLARSPPGSLRSSPHRTPGW